MTANQKPFFLNKFSSHLYDTAASKDSLKKKAAGLSRYGSISPKELKKNSGVRIAFLGGINEIGKNLTVFEYGNDMIILDCGMSFPDADMPGIDYVIPDFSYIERNADRIKALFITHGHEDTVPRLFFSENPLTPQCFLPLHHGAFPMIRSFFGF